MKRLNLFLITAVFYAIISPASAQISDLNPSMDESNDYLKKIVNYLYNLGGYLGYDLQKEPKDNQNANLINAAGSQLIENYAFNTVLGAIPVNAYSNVLAQFVPNNSKYQAINSFANYTFKSQSFSSPGGQQQGKVAVTALLDQQNFQNDPVSQAVLNILGTPDATYCKSFDGTTYDKDCKLLVQSQVMTNVMGGIPKPQEYFSYDYIQNFLPQLNSNTLIAPLQYSLSDSEGGTPSSSGPGNNDKGLTAQNQAQVAQNFIRYVSGAVNPTALPDFAHYSQTYNTANNTDGKTSLVDQKDAQAALANYFTSLRAYAAQASVGVSNLYYLLSKRMPQNQSATNANYTSQMMSEFTMATWRLYNPEKDNPKEQWINQINQASSAAVQKEIAVLLAEINYQLFLNRQQQDRLLLTETMILMQNTKAAAPDFTSETSEASN